MKNFKKLISISLFIVLMFTSLNICTFASTSEIHVSKSGSDLSGDGTSENPYLTIEKAKEAARGYDSATVIIEEGTYTVSDMIFTAEDSNVTYQGVGDVAITEAKDFSVSDFTVVKNPEILERLRPETWGKVYELGLGHYGTDITGIELYVDGKKMNISRYPNRGEYHHDHYGLGVTNPYLVAVNPAIVVGTDNKKAVYDNTFTVKDERVYEWKDYSDAYIVGSAVAGYQWNRRDIEGISENEITASDYVRDDADFYVCNLIEEIDVAGEYAYDSDKNMLYVYLPQNYETASVVLKGTTDPLITVRAENIKFNNIKFDKISKQVFSSKNSDGLTITNCEFNYIDAKCALDIDGKNMDISSNRVYGCTGGFVKFSGGEVTEEGFVYGEVSIKNNLISNCGDEEYASYMILCGMNAPEYFVDSIGNTISNNVIYNCGGTGAIGPTGNDLIVTNNEILNVARHIHDGGAIYSGRTNTKVGNVVSNNYIHHLNKKTSYVGLYSDDGLAGMTMTNNVLYDMRSGILVGAGMHGEFSDNMFIDNEKALALSSRMAWGAVGNFAGADLVDEKGYAYNKYGEKVYTFYGETKNAVTNYPKAYSKYDWMEDSLTRKPFFAPWYTKVNGNIHYTNDKKATLGTEENNDVIKELAQYNGESKDNIQTGYTASTFADFENQNFTLTSGTSNIVMSTIGLEDEDMYYNDNSFDFTPSYADGELRLVFDKSKEASKYIITLKKDGNTVLTEEYFDDNSDTAYETEVTAGETYEITVEAVNLTRQNLGSETVTKTYTVPASNDKTALSYVTALLEKEKAKADNGIYIYSDDINNSFDAVLENANTLISNESASAQEVSDMQNDILGILSSAQASRIVTQATINTPVISDTQARVTANAEDFTPYSYVSIVVTNPSYEKSDVEGNPTTEVVRYTDVKRTSFSGEVEFSFNTHVNGIDMPDYYNVYMIDENGREAQSRYYYGTIEVSDVTFKNGETVVEKEELINNKTETLNATLNVNNRMNEDIDAVVYCGIYEGNKLISISMVSDQTLYMNKVNDVTFDIEIPNTYTENSTVEIMICDKDTLLKPLTVKKNIIEIK